MQQEGLADRVVRGARTTRTKSTPRPPKTWPADGCGKPCSVAERPLENWREGSGGLLRRGAMARCMAVRIILAPRGRSGLLVPSRLGRPDDRPRDVTRRVTESGGNRSKPVLVHACQLMYNIARHALGDAPTWATARTHAGGRGGWRELGIPAGIHAR